MPLTNAAFIVDAGSVAVTGGIATFTGVDLILEGVQEADFLCINSVKVAAIKEVTSATTAVVPTSVGTIAGGTAYQIVRMPADSAKNGARLVELLNRIPADPNALVKTAAQTFSSDQKKIVRINLGIGNVDNLPGATFWEQIIHAVNGGYRYVSIENYDNPTIPVTSGLFVPALFDLYLGGARLEKAYNGPMFSLGDRSTVHDGQIDGKHASFTGDIFQIVEGNQQRIHLPKIIGAAHGYVVNFIASDETGLRAGGISAGVDGAGTGAELWIGSCPSKDSSSYSIKGPNNAPSTSGFARFHGIDGNGFQTFDFRAARGWTLDSCILGGNYPMSFLSTTYGIGVHGGRVAPGAGAQNIFGTGHYWNAPNFSNSANLILGAGVDNCVFNLRGNESVIDNSGAAGALKINDFYGHKPRAITPGLKFGTTVPNLGTGGSVVGTIRREGRFVHLYIKMLVGTSPTIPTGAIEFTLPTDGYATERLLPNRTGNGGRVVALSGGYFDGFVQYFAGTNAFYVLPSAAYNVGTPNYFSNSLPAAGWPATSYLELEVTYPVGT